MRSPVPFRGPVSALLAVILSVACAAPGLAAKAPEPLPTEDQIRALYDEGKYPELLQKLSRVLALKGDAALAYDRYEMLMLRGEAHLKLKAGSAALAAFAAAMKEAPDPAAAARARATEILLKRAKAFKYVPRGEPASEGIDVTDAGRRKAAFKALFAEERDAVTPKVKAARRARTLPEIAEGLKAAAGLATLELAATGKDDETKEAVGDLAARAEEMMADAVDDMAGRVEDLKEAANELVEFTRTVPDGRGGYRTETDFARRGLDARDLRELKDVVATCGRIPEAAADLAEATGEESRSLKDLADAADKVARRADDLLRTDFRAGSRTRRVRS